MRSSTVNKDGCNKITARLQRGLWLHMTLRCIFTPKQQHFGQKRVSTCINSCIFFFSKCCNQQIWLKTKTSKDLWLYMTLRCIFTLKYQQYGYLDRKKSPLILANFLLQYVTTNRYG